MKEQVGAFELETGRNNLPVSDELIDRETDLNGSCFNRISGCECRVFTRSQILYHESESARQTEMDAANCYFSSQLIGERRFYLWFESIQ